MLQFLDTDIDNLTELCKATLEKILQRKLAASDPLFLLLKSLLVIIAQQRILINSLSNENLLAFATGQNLEKIGELVGIERKSAASATCTVEVTLTAPREKLTIINAGTRINADNQINFALDADVIFLAGETFKSASATCLESGEVGNGYAIGEICRVVDPQPFLLSIINITTSEGGADIENDEELRERIRTAPESFSTAGPAGAYKFHTKNVSSQVSDVYVASDEPGEVTVYPLLKNGTVPEAEMLTKIYEHLTEDDIRPLTDLVQVKPPVTIFYNIEMEYWIAKSDQTKANAIIAAVEQAVDDFILWQKEELGRDINPTELYHRVRVAGAKRAFITSPEFLATPPHSVALADIIKVTFRGLEDN